MYRLDGEWGTDPFVGLDLFYFCKTLRCFYASSLTSGGYADLRIPVGITRIRLGNITRVSKARLVVARS